VNRVGLVGQTTRRWPAGTPTFSITHGHHSHTGSADSRWRVTTGVGPSPTHGDGAPRARSKGVTGAGTGTARFDHRGESRVEKPRGNDFSVDGSPRDRATGRSRARVETPPPTSGEPVLKPTGTTPGSLCAGQPRRSRRRGCHNVLVSPPNCPLQIGLGRCVVGLHIYF